MHILLHHFYYTTCYLPTITCILNWVNTCTLNIYIYILLPPKSVPTRYFGQVVLLEKTYTGTNKNKK